jgi:rhamnose utilization protein RhaD (predicted bifunctional aldolase and dehydrogenase)
MPISTPPKALIELSHKYGRNPDYIIAGGGNTSYKDKNMMFIKGSGVALAEIDVDGFVALYRSKIDDMLAQSYSSEPDVREKQVKDRLMLCRVDQDHGGRPSVESPFHHLLNYAYVVHTHPYLVNAFLSGLNSRILYPELFRNNFPYQTLYMEYCDPGYTLAKVIEKGLLDFRKNHSTDPQIIFLENHGVIVGANTPEEIDKIYTEIFTVLQARITTKFSIESLPNPKEIELTLKKVQEIYEQANVPHAGQEIRNHTLIQFFAKDQSNFKEIHKPFNPDTVVYCKDAPLFLPLDCSISQTFKDYQSLWGYLPKILILQQRCLIAIAENQTSARTAADMFEDALKVGYYTHFFGGPRGMSMRDIRFIDSWEVEQYRRYIAQKK